MAACKSKMGWQLPGSLCKAVMPGYGGSCPVDSGTTPETRWPSDFQGHSHRAWGKTENHKVKSERYQQVISEIFFVIDGSFLHL